MLSLDEAVKAHAAEASQVEQPEAEEPIIEDQLDSEQEAQAESESEEVTEDQLTEGEELEAESEDDEPGEVVEEHEDAEGAEEADHSFTVLDENGKEQVVDADEARDGYMRQAHFTRLTQAHAEKVRAFQEQAEQVQQRWAAMEQDLEAAEQLLMGTPPQMPPIDLLTSNPQEYEAQKRQYEEYAAYQQTLQQWRQGIAEQRQQEVQAKRQEIAQAEAKKFVEVFDIKDDAAFNAKVGEIQGYLAQTYGYNPAELNSMLDHRHYKIAEKARLYDEMMARTKSKASLKVKKAKIKPASSGAKPKTKPVSKRDKAKKNFHHATRPGQDRPSRRDQIDAAVAAMTSE